MYFFKEVVLLNGVVYKKEGLLYGFIVECKNQYLSWRFVRVTAGNYICANCKRDCAR